MVKKIHIKIEINIQRQEFKVNDDLYRNGT